jgi:hypothetical protein
MERTGQSSPSAIGLKYVPGWSAQQPDHEEQPRIALCEDLPGPIRRLIYFRAHQVNQQQTHGRAIPIAGEMFLQQFVGATPLPGTRQARE